MYQLSNSYLSDEDYSKDLGEARRLWQTRQQYRQLLSSLIHFTFFVLTLWFTLSNVAHAEKAFVPVPGVDYKEISESSAVEPGKVTVEEFFSYACPHCYHFVPLVEPWAATLDKRVKFVRVPVGFGNPTWGFVQKVYIALDEMGFEPKLHKDVFEAIHKDHLEIYHDRDALTAWVKKHGVDAKTFNSNFDSFSTSSKANMDNQLAMRYQVDQVPLLVINGKYIVYPANSGPKTFDIANYLINKEMALVYKK